jgi:threonine/homoserine/homoserine lactone efflux protein
VYNLIELLIFTATSFVVGLSGALVPGPMMTITISDSLQKGFITGPLIVLGHFIAELILIILLFAGLGWFIGSSTAVYIIGTLGGFMLILLGYKIVSTTNSLDKLSSSNHISNGSSTVINGILTSISNPFFFLWWATIGWAFMFKGIELAGIFGVLGFLVGHWASDLSWFSMVSFFTSRGSQIMTEKHYNILINSSGIFLIILGLYFLLNSQQII